MPLSIEILHPIANHDHHVAIGRDVGRVRQPAMARDDPGPALRPVFGEGQIQDLVQAGDHAVHASALFNVDRRITDGREEVAGADDLRMAERDDAIAIRVGCGCVVHHHAFPVEERRELVELVEVAHRRPGVLRRRRLLPGRGAHAVEHVLVRHDWRALDGGDGATQAAAAHPGSRGRNLLVAADVLGRRAGVDDVPDGACRGW